MSFERAGGILLHPTSLPGKYGIGVLGNEALKWIDFLHSAKIQIWQILPLGHTGFGDSPYQCFSTFAGNPLLIDPEYLVAHGLVEERDIPISTTNSDAVDYGDIYHTKYPFLRKAYQRFLSNGEVTAFESFCKRERNWLDDYALFMHLKDIHQGKSWLEWEDSFRLRNETALRKVRRTDKEAIDFYKFCQWIFFDQWYNIKHYANERGIKIIGDIPLYVALDSADTWSKPDVFQLDDNRKPTHVAGVPPDYFSATGQLWGNPLYDWEYLENHNYNWWVARVKAATTMYDIIRIDHFRGLEAYWSVPFSEETAMNGVWIEAPGKQLFSAIKKSLGDVPIIAEDLGVITPKVEELRDDHGFPGMKILHFAFHSDDGSIYLPHNYCQNAVAYTGTHDNDTTVGWFNSLENNIKDKVRTYIADNEQDIHWKMIRLAWASTANTAIAPLQDILGLDSKARMNTPGTREHNWSWRFKNGDLTEEHARVLRFFTTLFSR